jgi:EAL domain-containing protein (putative c-di-GMP-specific phosphodiesterase class I)
LSASGTYDYICIIENSRYITDFTQQAFYKIIAFFNKNRSLIPPDFQLSFNVSPAVFRWPKFNLAKMVEDEVDKDPDLASHLTIEITESAYTNKIISDIAIKSLCQLDELGVKVSIDDFGSGYGALKLLSSNIPKCIKLDRELTTEFCSSDISEQSYIKSLVHTVNISGLSVIAEGIETLGQKEFLIKNGIFYGQGYLYSKPLPEKEFMTYLQRAM